MASAIFKKPLPYLALLITHLIWGANFVVAKITLQEFPVMSLSFLRFALALVLILPFLFFEVEPSRRKIHRKDLPKLLLVGLFLVTINITLFYEGLKRTSAIDSSVLTMVIPILSVLGGWWFLKEKVFWVNLLGILLGLLGTALVIGLPLLFVGNFSTNGLVGNLLIILSSISFVIGAILSKEVLKTYHPLFVLTIMLLIGTLTFFIPAILDYYNNPNWIAHISIFGILGFLYIVILSTVSAMFLLEWGLSKINVVQANLFTYIEPAIAASLAAPLLGERISFSFIIGTCLVVLGVYWGTLGKPHHHHSQHKHHRT